ncbi:hypothetical protein CAEBREN_10807 [Caenorhabditis brenneri]|uniref:SH3 domain-containing protein n=1 Tax=Caenorhabditis brenneri TaxID=135651 RepID=G0PD36_CAEBE|nr:hypothetical protein CAEBREN_10807 [Caenorhabditis brenneri]
MGIRSIFWKVLAGRGPENGGWVDSMQVEHFDPYTPGQLTKNFTATVADEISVTRGTTVKALYRDDQWIYVQVSDGRKGFVPQTYCKLLLNERKRADNKDEICEAQVLQPFDASAPDDISAKEGERVTVLNLSDPEWTYIRNSENQSGFIPSTHVKIPDGHTVVKGSVDKEKWDNENLLVVEPFSGRSPLDLTVRPGEWIRCTGRPVDDWLWAVRIADEKQGFIPNKVVILATDL